MNKLITRHFNFGMTVGVNHDVATIPNLLLSFFSNEVCLLHSAVDGVVSHVSRLQKEAKEFANKKKKTGF